MMLNNFVFCVDTCKNASLLSPCIVFVFVFVFGFGFVFVFVFVFGFIFVFVEQHDVEVEQKCSIFLCSAYHGSTLASIHQIGAIASTLCCNALRWSHYWSPHPNLSSFFHLFILGFNHSSYLSAIDAKTHQVQLMQICFPYI